MGRVLKREQEGKTTAPWHKEECRICGEERKEEQMLRHRLIPKRFGGGDDEENVVNVCANCHRTLEAVYDDDFWDRAKENEDLDSSDIQFPEKQTDYEEEDIEEEDHEEREDPAKRAPWNQGDDNE